MPYKPTGRPPGRPRKAVVLDETEQRPVKTLKRARRFFREHAERLTPSAGVRIFGRRPRHKPSSQNRIA